MSMTLNKVKRVKTPPTKKRLGHRNFFFVPDVGHIKDLRKAAKAAGYRVRYYEHPAQGYALMLEADHEDKDWVRAYVLTPSKWSVGPNSSAVASKVEKWDRIPFEQTSAGAHTNREIKS
jgi:hypothetical protein